MGSSYGSSVGRCGLQKRDLGAWGTGGGRCQPVGSGGGGGAQGILLVEADVGRWRKAGTVRVTHAKEGEIFMDLPA